MRMKKIITLLAFAHLVCSVSAQNLTFVYVAHDETMPTERLVSVLKEVFESSYDESRCIMYLASGENPKVIVSSKSTNEEIDDFFNEFFNYDFHNVSPAYDRHRILEMVDGMGLLGNSFMNTTFRYYVSNSFVNDGYFEEVVAKGVFCMELAAFDRARVGIRVFTPQEDGDGKIVFHDEKGLLNGINIRYMNY